MKKMITSSLFILTISTQAMAADYYVNKNGKDETIAQAQRGITSGAILKLGKRTKAQAVKNLVKSYSMLRDKDCVRDTVLDNDSVKVNSLMGSKVTAVTVSDLGPEYQVDDKVQVTVEMDNGKTEISNLCELSRRAIKVNF